MLTSIQNIFSEENMLPELYNKPLFGHAGMMSVPSTRKLHVPGSPTLLLDVSIATSSVPEHGISQDLLCTPTSKMNKPDEYSTL